MIFMFDEGKIVEQGKYEEMMQRKRHFYKFVKGSKFMTKEVGDERIGRNLANIKKRNSTNK